MQVHWQCKCIDRDNHDCFVTQSPLKVSDYSFPYRLKSDTLFYFLPDITLFAADMHSSRNTPTGDNPRFTRHHDTHDFRKIFRV